MKLSDLHLLTVSRPKHAPRSLRTQSAYHPPPPNHIGPFGPATLRTCGALPQDTFETMPRAIDTETNPPTTTQVYSLSCLEAFLRSCPYYYRISIQQIHLQSPKLLSAQNGDRKAAGDQCCKDRQTTITARSLSLRSAEAPGTPQPEVHMSAEGLLDRLGFKSRTSLHVLVITLAAIYRVLP
jgi:hypothetical protein